MADVIKLLRAYPGQTEPADAARAIFNAVKTSANGALSRDAVDAARRALGALTQKPDICALDGLVDTVMVGACARSVDTFVLTASAWRALVALADLVRDTKAAGKILSAAATAATAVILRDDAKKLRLARFHVANAARFAKAFNANNVVPDGCPSAAADLCGVLALDNSDEMRKLGAPAALLLRVAFQDWSDWNNALCAQPTVGESFRSVAPQRTVVAIYLSRVARSQENRDEWNDLCAQKLDSQIVPFLFHVIETCGVDLLDVYQPCLCAMTISALRNVCDSCNTNSLLEYVASPSLLVSRTASMVLVERAKCGDNTVVKLVRECRLLSEALRSPHATQRWIPLEMMLNNDAEMSMKSVENSLEKAAGFSLLRRVRAIQRAEKQLQTMTDRAKRKSFELQINSVRAGAIPVKDADVQALARAAVSDKVDRNHVEMEAKRMALVAKYARVLVSSEQ